MPKTEKNQKVAILACHSDTGKTKCLNPLKIVDRSSLWNENFGGWEEDQENVLFGGGARVS